MLLFKSVLLKIWMYKFIVTLVTRPANSLYLGSLAPSQKSPGAKKKKEGREKRKKGEKRKKREEESKYGKKKVKRNQRTREKGA